MSVSKKLLKIKSDEELLSYIAKDNPFVPEASQIAFDILIERGYLFNNDEKQLIQNQINAKILSDENYIHPHHKSAGVLIFATCIIGFMQFIAYYDLIKEQIGVKQCLVSIFVMIILGIYTQRGSQSVKYIYVILFLLGFFEIAFIYMNHRLDIIFGIVSLIQLALQLWAINLLFRIPSKKTIN